MTPKPVTLEEYLERCKENHGQIKNLEAVPILIEVIEKMKALDYHADWCGFPCTCKNSMIKSELNEIVNRKG